MGNLSKKKSFWIVIQYEDIDPDILGIGVPHQVHNITQQSKNLPTSLG
jgi:hypothetical protein